LNRAHNYTLLSFQPCSMDIEWALLNRANNYRTLPNNEPRSVNNRSFGGEWAYFTRYLNFAPTDHLSRALLKSCNVSKCRSFSIWWLRRGQRGILLQRLAKEDGEIVWWCGERGWGGVPVGYRALIRNDGILDLFKEKAMAY